MKTTWKDIELLIVGAGTMGASLAQNYAQNGFNVGLIDISEEALQRGLNAIDQELAAAQKRIYTAAEVAAIKDRIVSGCSYEEACSGKNLKLVIEAATEQIEIKKKIFQQLDKLCPPETVLASNSSSLNTNLIAEVTNRPDKIVWMHYFYLPHKNRGGEYAGSDTASAESKAIARKYFKLGGKVPTHIRKSRKGGVADIIFVALLLEATRMLEEGFSIADIEAAGIRAYGIPIGFLELMDATGLPIGLFSMNSFSDASDPNDELFKIYGNFFAPRPNYIEVIKQFDAATDKSSVRWITDRSVLKQPTTETTVEALSDRFLAIGFVTASECVDYGLITIEDLESLAQNAFVWRDGPFTLMNRCGPEHVAKAVNTRAELAKKFGQTFPVCASLKEKMEKKQSWNFSMLPVCTDIEHSGAVRRITLNNPRSSNALNNDVFAELNRQFAEANADDKCKLIVFDTAPIKSFIAGADIKVFYERVCSGDIDAIVRDTAEWQRVMFHVMTGTSKPKIALVDGQCFGGGVEVACAFGIDQNSLVVGTNRTSFALPEARLGIYPGLRGTLNFGQIIYRHTGDAALAIGIARYFALSAGMPSSSPQLLHHLGFLDAIVPQHRRDEAVDTIAQWTLKHGKLPTADELAGIDFAKVATAPTPEELIDLTVACDLFNQCDLLPTLYAQASGSLPIQLTGGMKAYAGRLARRVADCSPNAEWITNYLISRGFEKHVKGASNDELAAFELEHFLGEIFRHPDAKIGLDAILHGKMAAFQRRYPLS